MEQRETLAGFFINRLSRCASSMVGLLTCAVGLYFQIQANFGMSPWSSLNLGISMNFPISYGFASIAISAIIIAVDLWMKEPIGLGTILNAVVIGLGTDVCMAIGFLSVQSNMIMQTIFLVIGIAFTCIGQVWYIRAGLSCGPRDTLLVGLGKRFNKVSIGTVNIVLLGIVFACCLALGSPAGLGTVISVFGSGVIMDLVFKVMKFDPKVIEHEDMMGTIRAFMRAVRK